MNNYNNNYNNNKLRPSWYSGAVFDRNLWIRYPPTSRTSIILNTALELLRVKNRVLKQGSLCLSSNRIMFEVTKKIINSLKNLKQKLSF